MAFHPAFLPPVSLFQVYLSHFDVDRKINRYTTVTSPAWLYRHRSDSIRKLPTIRSSSVQSTVACDNSPLSSNEEQRLSTWFIDTGISLSGVEIRRQSSSKDENNEERGLYATRTLTYGEQFVAFRREAIILVNALDDDIPDLRVLRFNDKAFWRSLPWYFRLAIKLIDETTYGKKSQFETYIASLPKEPGSAIWALQRRSTSKSTRKLLQKYGMWETSQIFMMRMNRAYNLMYNELRNESYKKTVTRDLFVWAVCMVVSRAFGLPGVYQGVDRDMGESEEVGRERRKEKQGRKPIEYALIPGLDMANHSTASNSKLKHDKENDCYCVCAGMHAEKGEQVFVSYGAKGNDELAFFYGIVEGRKPGNLVVVYDMYRRLRHLRVQLEENGDRNESEIHKHDCEDEEERKRLEVLNWAGLTREECELGMTSDGVDEDMMRILRVMHTTHGELENLLQMTYDKKEKNRDDNGLDEDDKELWYKQLGKSLSLRNEVAVWDTLLEWCEEMIKNIEVNKQVQQVEKRYGTSGVFSAVLEWGRNENENEKGEGEIVYQWERRRILNETIERLMHFKKISLAIGTVCTVLVPPSQSVLRAEVFDDDGGGEGDDGFGGRGAGLGMFDMIHKDIQATLEGNI